MTDLFPYTEEHSYIAQFDTFTDAGNINVNSSAQNRLFSHTQFNIKITHGQARCSFRKQLAEMKHETLALKITKIIINSSVDSLNTYLCV